jgi:hypothetical protein
MRYACVENVNRRGPFGGLVVEAQVDDVLESLRVLSWEWLVCCRARKVWWVEGHQMPDGGTEREYVTAWMPVVGLAPGLRWLEGHFLQHRSISAHGQLYLRIFLFANPSKQSKVDRYRGGATHWCRVSDGANTTRVSIF